MEPNNFLGSIKAPYPEFGNTSNFQNLRVSVTFRRAPIYSPTRVYDKTLQLEAPSPEFGNTSDGTYTVDSRVYDKTVHESRFW